MTMTHIFVTGTDTEVGKTRISVALMALMQQRGLKTAGMKPVASGCELKDDMLVNEDAHALMQQADLHLPYQLVNPYAFAPAIAPHLAAEQTGAFISIEQIKTAYQEIRHQWFDGCGKAPQVSQGRCRGCGRRGGLACAA